MFQGLLFLLKWAAEDISAASHLPLQSLPRKEKLERSYEKEAVRGEKEADNK
jgi:hypothetical protein